MENLTKDKLWEAMHAPANKKCNNCLNLVETPTSIYCALAEPEGMQNIFHECRHTNSLYRLVEPVQSWWEWDGKTK